LGWKRYWSVGAGEGAEEVEFGGLRIEGDHVRALGGAAERDGRERPFFFSRAGGVEREVGIVERREEEGDGNGNVAVCVMIMVFFDKLKNYSWVGGMFRLGLVRIGGFFLVHAFGDILY